jgi:curved DNA-binding protein CbpA
MARIDYYRVLGLSIDATSSQIKTRYKVLAKKYHPDHNGNDKVMSLINEAYAVLSNPRLRYQYNQSLQDQVKTNTNSFNKTHGTTQPSSVQHKKASASVSKFRVAKERPPRIFGLAVITLVAVLLLAGIVGSLAVVKTTNKPEIAISSSSRSGARNNLLATELKQAEVRVKKEQALAIQYAQQALQEKHIVNNESSALQSSWQHNIQTNQCTISKQADPSKRNEQDQTINSNCPRLQPKEHN